MSQQGLLQGSVRAVTGTALTWEGDWHALFDLDGIPAGTWNGRMLAWINDFLGTTYPDLPGAQAAMAAEAGASNWSSIGDMDLSGSAIVISPASLPAATEGVAYSQALSASGGTAPYTYAITSGALPAGLTLSSAGLLSGTPTVDGAFVFRVTATDAVPATGSRNYLLAVAAIVIAISPSDVPDGQEGVAYSQAITASGGIAPYTYAVTAGTLPAGLSLSAAGVLSGTPSADGSYSFTVTATDAGSNTGARAYAMDVAEAAVVVGGGAALLEGEANGFGVDFLHVTDAERVAVKETLGPELVTNGGFDSDTSWVKDADWSIAGGVATKVAGASSANIYQTIAPLVSGKSYRVTYSLSGVSGAGQMMAYFATAVVGAARATSGTYTEIMTATAAHTQFKMHCNTGTISGSLDNFSLREVVSVGTETTTAYAVDAFFANAGTSPKQVYGPAGVLGWSPHNMILQSQTFEQATPWNPTTAVTITANAIAAPDGTMTADKLVETASNTNHQIIHAAISHTIVGATYTISVYAKAGERNWLAITSHNTSATDFFDLTNGVVGTSPNGGVITAAGGGWYRCSITIIAASNLSPCFYNRTADGQVGVYLGDITKGLYLWGAQVNRGATPTAYIPTTTAARFGLALDHDPATLSPKGLLGEPAATNLLTDSNTFVSGWTTTGFTLAKNATGPMGANTATTLTMTAGAASKWTYDEIAGGNFRYSVFAKAGTLSWIALGDGSGGPSQSAYFNVLAGTIGMLPGAFPPPQSSRSAMAGSAVPQR